jgi:hypothetical protein
MCGFFVSLFLSKVRHPYCWLTIEESHDTLQSPRGPVGLSTHRREALSPLTHHVPGDCVATFRSPLAVTELVIGFVDVLCQPPCVNPPAGVRLRGGGQSPVCGPGAHPPEPPGDPLTQMAHSADVKSGGPPGGSSGAKRQAPAAPAPPCG